MSECPDCLKLLNESDYDEDYNAFWCYQCEEWIAEKIELDFSDLRNILIDFIPPIDLEGYCQMIFNRYRKGDPMGRSVPSPLPPRPYPRGWAEPQRTLPQPPPNQPSTNGNTLLPTPQGGGGNA